MRCVCFVHVQTHTEWGERRESEKQKESVFSFARSPSLQYVPVFVCTKTRSSLKHAVIFGWFLVCLYVCMCMYAYMHVCMQIWCSFVCTCCISPRMCVYPNRSALCDYLGEKRTTLVVTVAGGAVAALLYLVPLATAAVPHQPCPQQAHTLSRIQYGRMHTHADTHAHKHTLMNVRMHICTHIHTRMYAPQTHALHAHTTRTHALHARNT